MAWGSDRPVILIQQEDTAPIGVVAQSYSSIKALETLISAELDALSEKGLL
jgi:hypothetical protein